MWMKVSEMSCRTDNLLGCTRLTDLTEVRVISETKVVWANIESEK